jgi:serine/threonine protein kinase
MLPPACARIRDLLKGSILSLDQAFDDLRGRTVLHYRILEKLGEGGMGTIYKARDERLDRFVALKFLPPYFSAKQELKVRFIHEAKAAAALDHANICTVYEIGEAPDGQLFISMPCYEGETLMEKIQRGPLGLDEAIAYARQIAQGLAHAHAAGIVHRDIKPANLFVTNRANQDFGFWRGQVVDVKLTSAGMIVGTSLLHESRGKHPERLRTIEPICGRLGVLYNVDRSSIHFRASQNYRFTPST